MAWHGMAQHGMAGQNKVKSVAHKEVVCPVGGVPVRVLVLHVVDEQAEVLVGRRGVACTACGGARHTILAARARLRLASLVYQAWQARLPPGAHAPEWR